MIQSIAWFRTTLIVEYQKDQPAEAILREGRNTYALKTEKTDSGTWRAYLELCTAADGSFLPEGTWVLDFGEELYSDEVLFKLDTLQRVFRYDRTKAYIVTFSYDQTENRLTMRTSFMRSDPAPEKRSLKQNLMTAGLTLFFRFQKLFAKDRRHHVLFLSETREQMADNMRVVADRIRERGLEKDYTVTQLLQNDISDRMTPMHVCRLLMALAKNAIIFVDDYIPILSYLKLPKDTKLIQLWHAGFGYKLVGYARFGIEGSPHPYRSCHRQYTTAVVGNPGLKPVYTEVFGIPEEKLLATGMPRLEHFLDQNVQQKAIQRVHTAHPILNGKRVILFAPTYRGYNQADAYYEYDRIDVRSLYDMCQKTDSILVFKWHHFIRERIRIDEAFQDRLIDLSDESIMDLLYTADILVTDYSSVFYDYLLLERPIVFYIYDEAHYTATRGVHYAVRDTAPGVICRTSEELVHILSQKKIEVRRPMSYMTDMCKTNGTYLASDRIIDYVFYGKSGSDHE